MTDRFTQARELVRDAITRLNSIENSYRDSLDKKNVDVALQVGIKGILDNLRSALDYMAYELFQQYGSRTKNSNIYFPIADKGAKQIDFKSLVGRNIPGLFQNRPDLVSLLETFQEFFSSDNSWLCDFATLSVENKHKQLTPQKRVETKRVNVKTPSVSINWDPDTTIYGSVVNIGGVPVNPATQLPIPSPTQIVTQEIWVSFDFADINQPVLPFLKKVIKGVESIIKNISYNVEKWNDRHPAPH